MTGNVKRWFELRGRDSQELERRIDTLQQAIAAKHGIMLIIKRSKLEQSAACVAHVLYEIPTPSGGPAARTSN